MNDLDIELELAAAAAKAARKKKSLGTRLWENIAGDNDPTTQNTGERIGTLLNMAGETMTMGLGGDEANAALVGLGAAVVPGGKGFRQAYDDRLAFERQQQLIAEDDAPVASTVAKLGGALAGAALTRSPQSLAGAVGVGAGMGGTLGFMEGEGGLANRFASGGTGAILGGVLGAAAIPVGKALTWAVQKGGNALRGVLANRQFFQNGQLTEEGAKTLQALGYSLDDLDESFRQQFQRGIREGLQPQESAAVANLREFNIPAFRANVTGLADDFATMERARRGALGPNLTQEVGGAMDAQMMAAREAGSGIASRLAGGVQGDAADAAQLAIDSARATRDTMRNAASTAYDDLAASGAGVQGPQVQNLGTRIARAVQNSDNPIRIDGTATPNAANAANYLDDVFRNANQGSVPFMSLERARQQMVRYRSAAYRGANGADQTAMDQVLSQFDAQVDDLMTRALTEGDAAVLGQAEKARALWANYKQQFAGDGAGSKFVQKMIDEDASPDQVVNWLFGAGELGKGSFNATVARNVQEVVSPEAWDMIRSSAFKKLIARPEGMDQPGPQAMSQAIGKFFTNPATRDLSRTLFTKEEIATFMRYQMALKRMVAPPGAVNTSGTSYENARMARNAFQALTAMFGATTGGAPGMLAASGAANVAQRGSNWLTGRAILSPTAPAGTAGAPFAAGALAGNIAGPASGAATNLLGQGQPR